MNRILRSTWARRIAVFLTIAMVSEYAAVCIPPAQAQASKQTVAVAVVPFTDNTGYKSQIISAKTTDAIALALEDSSEFVVTSQADLQREMRSLSLAPPLLEPEQVRLGKRLRVDKVISGTVDQLSIEARTGRCTVSIDMRSLDVNTEEYLNGATVTVTTKGIPGWEGDEVRVINEGVREAAENAVQKMLATRVPRGNVDLVDDLGVITLNVGTRDGMEPGRDLLVARPQWQPDQEKVFMRKIGVISVDDADANMSRAKFVSGLMPRTGDKVYALYRPGQMNMGAAPSGVSGQSKGSATVLIGGLLALVGLIAIAKGPTTASASGVQTPALVQVAGGAGSLQIRVPFSTGNTERTNSHGFLVFRGENVTPLATAPYLIDMVPDEGAHIGQYTDVPNPTQASVTSFVITFTFTDVGSSSGSTTTGTVTGTWNHTPLVPGNTYSYIIQRIISPLLPAGSNPPSATKAVVTPVLTVAPDNRVLSQPSAATVPVTYFLPPTIGTLSPNRTTTQNPNSILFQWNPGAGGNSARVVYRVEVYSDIAMTHLITASREIPGGGVTPMSFTVSGLSAMFPSGQTFYYRIAARVPTETTSYIYSEQGNFQTVTLPPGTPGVVSGAAVTASQGGAATPRVSIGTSPILGGSSTLSSSRRGRR